MQGTASYGFRGNCDVIRNDRVAFSAVCENASMPLPIELTLFTAMVVATAIIRSWRGSARNRQVSAGNGSW